MSPKRRKQDEEEYKKTLYALDFTWSDEARLYTFLKKREAVRHVVKIRNAFGTLIYTLFECFGQKDHEHPAYELITLEAELDFHASILLAFSGYYKQALMCLRSVFELIYYAMYYEQHREEYTDWKKGLCKSPLFRNILPFVFKETNLKQHKQKWESEISRLYNYLSQFVHTGAIDMTKLWEGRDNAPRFLPNSFDLWYQALQRVSRVAAVSSIIQWGDSIKRYLGNDKSGMYQEIISLLEQDDVHDLAV